MGESATSSGVDYAAVPQPHGLLVVEGVVVALVPKLDMEISGVVQQIQGLQLFGIRLVQCPHLPGGHVSRLQLIQQLPASVCWTDINHLAGNVTVAVPFAGLEIALVLIGGGVGVSLQAEGQALVPDVAQFLQPIQHCHSGGQSCLLSYTVQRITDVGKMPARSSSMISTIACSLGSSE